MWRNDYIRPPFLGNGHYHPGRFISAKVIRNFLFANVYLALMTVYDLVMDSCKDPKFISSVGQFIQTFSLV